MRTRKCTSAQPTSSSSPLHPAFCLLPKLELGSFGNAHSRGGNVDKVMPIPCVLSLTPTLILSCKVTRRERTFLLRLYLGYSPPSTNRIELSRDFGPKGYFSLCSSANVRTRSVIPSPGPGMGLAEVPILDSDRRHDCMTAFSHPGPQHADL